MSRIFLIFIHIIFSLSLWADNINIILDNTSSKEYPQSPDLKSSPANAAYVHQELLLSLEPANIPSRLDFKITNTIIDGQLISRSLPIIDGIEVEGADGIYAPGDNATFNYSYFDFPKALFILNPAQALEKALVHSTSTLSDPYVEKIAGSYEQIWLMYFNELRPAYKTRLPVLNIEDLQDIYIDGENGEVLKIEPSAQFLEAPASLFIYSPDSSLAKASDLKPVMLKNLVSLKENDYLRGEYISVRNCCHYYTCPEEGPCNDNTKRCALESHKNAMQSFELVDLPTSSLGLDPLLRLPETISVNAVRCTYLPFAKASFESSHGNRLGFFEQPIDEPTGIASEMDRFSEVQAYNSVMTFFNHMRFLLADPTWCLRKNAMSCEPDGRPVLDEQGHALNAYKVFVNQMIPDMKSEHDPDGFIAQVLAGRGSKDNPVHLKKFIRMGNAAFIPALSTLKASTPRADEILSDLIKPYDHNVFFQGARDFAYDGDVVFHEFMHAVTTSMVNKLNTLGINEWGIHSEPGSLNEGWSDYFAAAFSNRPAIGSYAAIKDGFGEASLRDVDNNLRCPNDVIGEIHRDGLVWSGALWQIRENIKKNHGDKGAIEFDRAVLTALAQAKTTEDFKSQSEKLLKSISERASLGPQIASDAKVILEQRGLINCFRAYALSHIDKNNNLTFTPKKTLMIPSKNQIGLKNYAPSSSQLAIAIPVGTQKIKVSWRQYLGGTGALLGTETTPDKMTNMIPLGVIASLSEPIKWSFKNKQALPTRSNGPINTPIKPAIFHDGRWQFSQEINFTGCKPTKLYLSLLSNDYKFILEDINVEYEISKESAQSCSMSINEQDFLDTSIKQGCSSYKGSSLSGLFMLAALFLMRKRRYRR